MKFIALILSVLVLTLSVVPCCALESAFEQEHHQDQCSSDKDHHEGHDDCCGHCSPFYTCGTCPGCVLTAPVVYPSAGLSFEPNDHHGLYLEAALQELPNSIWQPPKIG